jgi:hypothetical protein
VLAGMLAGMGSSGASGIRCWGVGGGGLHRSISPRGVQMAG